MFWEKNLHITADYLQKYNTSFSTDFIPFMEHLDHFIYIYIWIMLFPRSGVIKSRGFFKVLDGILK